MADQPQASPRLASPDGRLRELARIGAESRHWDANAYVYQLSGHDGAPHECPHPDCVLVHSAALLASAAPVPAPPAQETRLSKAARWAERQLNYLVTDDDGDGAFVRGTGTEVAGFGAGVEELRFALKDAACSAPSVADSPTLTDVEKLVERLWSVLTVSKRWELFGAGITIDPIIIALRKLATPSAPAAPLAARSTMHELAEGLRLKAEGEAKPK